MQNKMEMSPEEIEKEAHGGPLIGPEKVSSLKLKVLTKGLEEAFQKGFLRARGIHEALDALIDEKLKNSPRIAAQITCHKGCAACCHQTIFISDSEKDLIIQETLRRKIHFTRDERERLRKQAKAARKGEWGELKWNDKKCVFLNAANECRIYEDRPSVCRSYFVVSPPAQCDFSEKVQATEYVNMKEVNLLQAASILADDPTHENTESLPEHLAKVF